MAKISFTNDLAVSTNVLNLGDYFQAIKPLHTFQCTNTVMLGGNRPLKSGHVYEFEVLFRPRGDGVSSPTKCSSMGFVTYWNNWAEAFATIRYSTDAYKDLGMFVRQSYRFTASKDVQPTQTCLWCTIENDFSKGTDNQNIDVYYYRFQDMTDSSIKDVKGINAKIFEMFDSKTNRLFYNFLYGTDDSSHILMSGIRGFNSFQDKCTNLTLSPINYGDIGGIESIDGIQSYNMTSGHIVVYPIKNVGNIRFNFTGNPNNTELYSAMFYDYEVTDGDTRYNAPTRRYSQIDTTLNIHVFKNTQLVETIKSTETKMLTFNNVVPGDCFYLKVVLSNGGGIIYAKDVYGAEHRIYKQKHESGWAFTYKVEYTFDEDISPYRQSQDFVNSQISIKNTEYGWLTEAGNSSRSNEVSGLGSVGYGNSGTIIINFDSPSNYDQFISILRSRQ